MAGRAQPTPVKSPTWFIRASTTPTPKSWNPACSARNRRPRGLGFRFRHGRHHDRAASPSCKPGQNIIYTVPIYGGTQHLIEDFLTTLGIGGVPVEAGHTGEMDEAIRSTKNLAVVLIETPANPTIVMTDIRHATDAVAHLNPKPVVMVDNTLLGPTFQHPLLLGADLASVLGHQISFGLSDLIAGIALASDPNLIRQNALQAQPLWQHSAARRMLDAGRPPAHRNAAHEPSSKNAERIATRLAKHPKVERVLYPTLFTDREQVGDRAQSVRFPRRHAVLDLRGGKRAAFEFLRNLRIARNAVSLGGVETLVCHPKTTTHSGFTEEEFAAAGVTDGLVRISIGIEDWRDLMADFEQALDLSDLFYLI